VLPPFLQLIVDFLRKGYPQGVPDQDYLPLFALLRRRLSDDEVVAIADELASNSSDEHTSRAIQDAIAQVTVETPSEADEARVRDHLEAAGWEPPARANA
jgi:propanediol dehydratase small subunit